MRESTDRNIPFFPRDVDSDVGVVVAAFVVVAEIFLFDLLELWPDGCGLFGPPSSGLSGGIRDERRCAVV